MGLQASVLWRAPTWSFLRTSSIRWTGGCTSVMHRRTVTCHSFFSEPKRNLSIEAEAFRLKSECRSCPFIGHRCAILTVEARAPIASLSHVLLDLVQAEFAHWSNAALI